MSRRSWLLFSAMCVIWGIPYMLIRVAVRDVSPSALVFARTAIGALVLLPIAWRRGAIRPVLARWPAVVAFTITEVAVPWLLLNDAETRISSSLSGLLIAAVPLVGVLVGRFGPAREHVAPMRLAGLIVGMIGVGLLLGLDVSNLQVRAVAEVAVVVLGYAVAPVILSRQLADVPGIGVVFCSLTLCAVGYAPTLLVGRPHHLEARPVLAVIALGLVCTALAFVLFYQLIAAIGPSRAVVITFVNPAVAVLLGVSLLGESLTAGMVVGFPLILVGCVLAARASRHDRARAAAPADDLSRCATAAG